jgi:DNA-binding transcriptional regulator YdaS (Cro superfamily)
MVPPQVMETMMLHPLHELFEIVGKTLFGDGPMWKAQLAYALGIRPDSVDNMAKGKSRIPPGVWEHLGRLIDGRVGQAGALLPSMKSEVLEAAQWTFKKREIPQTNAP